MRWQWSLLVLLGACSPGRTITGTMEPRDSGPRPDAGPDSGVFADAAPLPDGEVPDAGDRPDAEPAVDTGPLEMLPTGTAVADEIRINETVRFQTMDGVGANAWPFAFGSDIGWRWENVQFVFDEVDIHYVRMASWFRFWEENNDDNSPTTVNWNGFGNRSGTIPFAHDIPFARWMAARNIEVSLGVWDTSDWLASGSPRRVQPAMYPELGESIATYVLNLQNNGVPQVLVEVQNEPTIEASIQYTPQTLRDAALAVLDQLDRQGLNQVMLHGPNVHAPGPAPEWAEVWFSNQRLRDRTAALSFHSWWSDSFAEFDAIREVAERYNKPVWVTETGYCALPSGCFNGTHFLLPETWGTAWDYATSSYRGVAWSRATRLFHWSLIGNDGAVSPTGIRFPSLSVLKHFANYIQPGAQYLDSDSGDDGVWVLPFAENSGSVAVVLLNTNNQQRVMKLTSVRGTRWAASEVLTSREGATERPGVATGPNGQGQVELTLPPQSVTSLRLR